MTGAYDYDALLAEQPAPPSSLAYEYDALIKERDREEQTRLRANLLDAYGRDPEETARAIRLSKERGLPIDTVLRNFARVEAAASVERDFAIVRGHAGLEKWLQQDPVNARVAQGDVEKLGFVERALRGVTDTLIRAPLEGVIGSVGSTFAGLGEGVAVSKRMARRAFDWVGMPDSGISLPRYVDLAEVLQQPGQNIKQLASDVGVPKERQNMADRIASSVGRIGAQIVQTIATGGTGAVVQLFGQGVDQMVDDVKKSGKYGTLAGDATLVAGGAVTALTERMGIDLLLNRLPPAIKNKVLRAAADITVAGGIEATEEFLEQVARNGVQNAIVGTDKPLLEGALDAVVEAGSAASIVHGGLGLRGKTRGSSTSRGEHAEPSQAPSVEEVRAEATAVAVDKLVEAASATKLATRSPEKLHEFLITASPEGQQTIYLRAEAVQSHLEALPPEEAQRQTETLGISKQLPRALAEGSDVAVPLAKYVVEAGRSDAHRIWRDDIRLELDGLSLNEARAEADLQSESAPADPIGYEGGLNLYAYVDNDPMNLVDPMGLAQSPNQNTASGGENAGFQLVASDADPDFDWTPGAQYASRGRAGPTAALTPAQLMRVQNFSSLHRQLQQLVPGHPAAAPSLSSPNWVPTPQQIQNMQGHVLQARAYVAAVQAANQQFPHLVSRPPELHHRYPQYLGGPANGPTVPLPRAYHQVITNAFRQAYPYGSPTPSPAEAQTIMQRVYATFPLPW